MVTSTSKITAIISEAEQERVNIRDFMELITQYIDVQELDRVIVHELIEEIVIHQAQRIDGRREQEIDIFYRFVGETH